MTATELLLRRATVADAAVLADVQLAARAASPMPPGIHPRECMEHYGRQLTPLLVRLFERGGGAGLTSNGDAIDRQLWRGSLAGFLAGSD